LHLGAIEPRKQPADIAATYSGMTMRGLRDRRIASTSIERAEFSMSGPPELGNFTAEIGQVASADIDLGVFLAILDPAEAAKADTYRRFYGRTTIGSYKGQFDKAGRFQIDSVSIEG